MDENSIITDDISIYKRCLENNIDALFIEKDINIKLKGFDYGFIGGCCGKIAKNILAVAGNYHSLTEKSKIDVYLKSKNIAVKSLYIGDITDIGTIIIIK